MWFVAQLAELLTMNETIAGSNPADPPKSVLDLGFRILDWNLKSEIPNLRSYGAVAERRMHFPVEEDDDGSSPFGPATSSVSSSEFQVSR